MITLKKLVQWTMILLAVGIAILVAYLSWLAMRIYWAPIIVIAYLTIGSVTAIGGLVGATLNKRKVNRDSLFVVIGEAQARAKSSTIRLRVARILSVIDSATAGWLALSVWLVKLVLETVKSGGQRILARQIALAKLQGLGHRTAPIVLVATVTAYVAAWLRPSESFWMWLFLIVLAANVLARHLGYAITPTPLPTQLRQKLGNAYLSFLTIAAADVLSLVLIFNAIFNWRNSNIISLSDLISTFKGLWFGHFTELVEKPFSGELVPVRDAILTATGALLSLNFLETAYKFREFRRTDQDNMAIASSYSLMGRFADALSSLDKIKIYTSEYYFLRGQAHLGVMQADRAWSDISRAINLRPPQGSSAQEKKPPSANEILLVLAGTSSIAAFPRNSVIALFKQGVVSGATDSYLTNALFILFPEPGVLSQAEPVLSGIIANHDLPMVHAVLLLAANRLQEASNELDKFKSANFPEKFMRETLGLLINLSDPTTSNEQDRSVFSAWSSQTLDELGRTDFGSLEPLDLAVIASRVLVILKMAESLAPEYQQSWQYILNEVQKRMAPDPGMSYLLNWMQKSEL